MLERLRSSTFASDTLSQMSREALLDASFGRPQPLDEGTDKQIRDDYAVAFFARPRKIGRYTDQQQRALDFYLPKIASNRLAMNLVRANLLFTDTLDGSGRIIRVRLPDERSQLSTSPPGTSEAEAKKTAIRGVGAKSALSGFLVFLRGYRGATRGEAPYHREGFRLWMKKEGFTVPDEGISALGDVEKPARRTPLTPGEQFKLDCLVVHALCDPARLRLGLSVLEQRTLDQTMARFTTKLDLRNPANFVKKWKEAFDLIAPLDRFDGDARTDRQTLLKAAKNALGYRGSGPKLADTIERWLHSTSPDGADLQKKWKEAMSFMRNAHARSAFQDCICTFLKEKKPRAGAQQGLLRALEESSTKDNPEEVARMIAEAARRVKKKE